MNILETKSIEQLLSLLPHRLQVRFALDCVNDVRHLLKDERAIKALEITELWLEGKATDLEIRDAAKDAYVFYTATYADASYAYFAAYTTYVAAYTAYYAAYTTYAAADAAHAAAYAVNVAAYAAKAQDKPKDFYKPKLIQMIENMTEFERVLYIK